MADDTNVPKIVNVTAAFGALLTWGPALVTDQAGVAVDLSSAIISADIRASQNQSSDVIASWTALVDSAVHNQVTLFLVPEDQADFTPGVEYWSDAWVDIGGDPLPFARFNLVFRQLVTIPATS